VDAVLITLESHNLHLSDMITTLYNGHPTHINLCLNLTNSAFLIYSAELLLSEYYLVGKIEEAAYVGDLQRLEMIIMKE